MNLSCRNMDLNCSHWGVIFYDNWRHQQWTQIPSLQSCTCIITCNYAKGLKRLENWRFEGEKCQELIRLWELILWRCLARVAQGSYLKWLVGGYFTVSCQKSKDSFKKPHLEGHVRSRPVRSEKLRPENWKISKRLSGTRFKLHYRHDMPVLPPLGWRAHSVLIQQANSPLTDEGLDVDSGPRDICREDGMF